VRRLHDAKTLVVVRQTEIVAVLVLGADADPCRLCDRVDALPQRLRGEGIALAMGVSTVATGVEDLPRAYQEAHVAPAGVGRHGGVEALARLTPPSTTSHRTPTTPPGASSIRSCAPSSTRMVGAAGS
jgi:diguanylate cyclase with GGDEF domain